jgi:hypothetical protein
MLAPHRAGRGRQERQNALTAAARDSRWSRSGERNSRAIRVKELHPSVR